MASHFVKAKLKKKKLRTEIVQLSVISEVNDNHSGKKYSVQGDSVGNLVVSSNLKGTNFWELLLMQLISMG